MKIILKHITQRSKTRQCNFSHYYHFENVVFDCFT